MGQAPVALRRGHGVNNGNTGMGAVRWSNQQFQSRWICRSWAAVKRTLISLDSLSCSQNYAGVPECLWLYLMICWRWPQDFGHLYSVASRSYWARGLFFSSYIRERQKISRGWRNDEHFGVRLPDCFNYYCGFPVKWMQYEPPNLLFIPSTFVLAYYNFVAMPGFTADQTMIWIISLARYVFTAGVMFIVTAKDGVCPTYYSGNLRFDHVSSGL